MKDYFLNMLLVLAVIIAGAMLFRNINDVGSYWCADLRSRIAATRHLAQGFDPYFLARERDSTKNTSPKVTCINTATPTALILYRPLVWLPYKNITYFWLAVNWLLALGAILIFAKSSGSSVKSRLIWFISLFFICGSHSWRLHAERGQMYLLYVFLLAVAYGLSQRKSKASHIGSGFVIGLTASLRPTMILMCFPILLYKKWKAFIGVIGGLIFGIVTSLITAGVPLWKSYFASIKELNSLTPNGSYFGSTFFKYATQLEGMYKDMNGIGTMLLGGSNTSLKYLLDVFCLRCHLKDSIRYRIPSQAVLMVWLIVIISVFFFLYRHRIKNISNSLLFLIGAGLVLLTDHFIPLARFSYNDVLWIIPLSLIIIEADSLSFFARPSTVILLFCLSMLISFEWLWFRVLLGEFAMILYLAIIIVAFIKRNDNRPVDSALDYKK